MKSCVQITNGFGFSSERQQLCSDWLEAKRHRKLRYNWLKEILLTNQSETDFSAGKFADRVLAEANFPALFRSKGSDWSIYAICGYSDWRLEKEDVPWKDSQGNGWQKLRRKFSTYLHQQTCLWTAQSRNLECYSYHRWSFPVDWCLQICKIKIFEHSISRAVSNCVLWFYFTTLCDWFKNLTKPRLGHTRYPALSAGYVYSLRVLIGSLCCFRWLSLVIVIEDVLILYGVSRCWSYLSARVACSLIPCVKSTGMTLTSRPSCNSRGSRRKWTGGSDRFTCI